MLWVIVKGHMKHCTLIILTIILFGFSGFSQLNRQINKSQKESIKDSPFETAKGMSDELKIQKKYRLLYIADIDSLLRQFPNDTIILTENYDFVCFGCPADNVQILVDSLLITFSKEFGHEPYQKKTEPLCLTSYYTSSLVELKNEIRIKKHWYAKPNKFGTDGCFDGGHTLYTVFYPDGNIISMYIRCWITKEDR